MRELEFGRHVMVAALTMRVVAYRDGEAERFKIPQAADVPWFEPITDEWPGDPIDLDWDLPPGPRFVLQPALNGHGIVRYRRHALNPPQPGVVVGSTWRYEGKIEEIPDGTTNLTARRKILLYQAALRPPGRRQKALVVYVHPKDLTALDLPVPAGAPLPRIRTGRLGGG